MPGAVFFLTALLFTFLLGAQVREVRVPLSPRWTRRLIIFGVLFDVASTLSPWGLMDTYLFLPFSPFYFLLPTGPFSFIEIDILASLQFQL